MYLCICCRVSGGIASLIRRDLGSPLEEFARDGDVGAGVVDPPQGWEGGLRKTAELRGVTAATASASG